MAQGLPIRFTELVQLASYDVQQSSIGFNSCTLESDSYVCIRQTHETTGAAEVIIIDLKNGNNVIRRPIKADSAIMHWTKQIIALKAQQRTLQVFDLAQKAKLKSATMNEDVVYWKWFSETSLGLVTDSAVYHWDVFDPTAAQPAKMFDRNPNLSGCQIINYRVSEDGQWMVVVGISQQQGRVVGAMQLYSRARGISQSIEGHAAAFGTIRLDGATSDTKLFTFAVRTATGAKLHVVEVDHQAPNPQFQKKNVDVYFPAEATNDFPVAMQVSQKYSIIYLVTKYGFIHLYDLETASSLFVNRISSETIFTTATNSDSTGIVGVNRKGQVLSVTVDETNIIPYILKNSANADLAYNLASRAGLPGADQLYQHKFEQLLAQGQYLEAAKTAANSPRGFLRTPQTIERFKQVPPPQQGQLSVILQYFGLLLDKGSLNKYETLELVRPVLAQNRKHLLEKWLKENKLECTEELGDIVRPSDLSIALTIYQRAQVPNKVVGALAELGQFEKILPYTKEVGYMPDWLVLIQSMVNVNPDRAVDFATALAKDESVQLDNNRVVDIFQSRGNLQPATAFLLNVLGENRPEDGPLQTKLLEMNLMGAPQVADAILGNEMFSYYDKPRIAQLCENAGLLTRALEHNDDPAAIKRMIVQTDKLPEEWLLNYFGQLSPELSLECLDEMLKFNIRQNLQAVIRIAQKYQGSGVLEPTRIIALLEKYRTAEGLYYFLGSIVNISEDRDVVFKYIEAATKMGQINEVERVCRENNHYDPEKVKNFLKEANLTEQLPLITVCDRFNFVHDLILYLYQRQQFASIEAYVQRINPSRTPAVIGGLLDVDCPENTLKSLLGSVNPASVPIDELVNEVESRNRLKLLLPFLEATLQSGNQQQAVYNALAKIYIDSNNNPERFLQENDQYDTLIIGKYCENRDPNLAYIAYRKGQNDLELIDITNRNSFYKQQARYLLERKDLNVWHYALNPSNFHRRSLVDQVVATAVPESHDDEAVSIAVKAFIDMDLPLELIELLEKIILEPSPFDDNPTLQNLLVLTATKNDKGRVMNYIHQLNNYTVDEIAPQLLEQGLHDEAFELYKRHNDPVNAVSVLTDYIVSVERAQEYADRVDQPEVWSKVAKAQLDGLRVNDSIESYIRAGDPSNFNEVIQLSTEAGKDEELVKYLKMARKTLREPAVDTGLAFCFARLNQLSDLDEFLRGPNVADVEASGDKAYEEGYYEAAKIFYKSISNWAKLATTDVHLGNYGSAVENARKANSVKVWKQVFEGCVEKKEFRLAKISGQQLIVHAEELANVVRSYERNGYFDELIDLLESGTSLERAHMGMFTELGIALAKYHPEKVMEHLRYFTARINIPKMITACMEAHLWRELIFLYENYDEPDNAALAMMERAADAWEHQTFKEVIVKVANLEIYYRALSFYRNEHPTLLNDLLQALTPRIDVNRVVTIFQKSDDIPLIENFLVAVQGQNKRAVNNALHDLWIEKEDYKALGDSVSAYDNYDAPELAQRLERHELVFFRQIAANIWRKNRRWNKSIELSKQDRLYKDAIETAAISAKAEVVEELLRYFIDIGSRECYVGMLYACNDLLRPDLILELSWRSGLQDFTMPFMINMLAQQFSTIETLKRDNEERKAREAASMKKEEDTPILGSRLMLTQGPAGGMGAGIQQSQSPGPGAMYGAPGQTNGVVPQMTGFRAF